MTRVEIFDALNEVFREVFDDSTLQVGENTTSSDIDGWDSLVHITLIAEIEDAFGIRIKMSDALHMKNTGELIDVISALAK